MDSLILLMAEQGHWFIAFVLVVLYVWHERRLRESGHRFRAMLEAHDGKNDVDFRRLGDKIDEVSQRLARIEGALLRKDS